MHFSVLSKLGSGRGTWCNGLLRLSSFTLHGMILRWRKLFHGHTSLCVSAPWMIARCSLQSIVVEVWVVDVLMLLAIMTLIMVGLLIFDCHAITVVNLCIAFSLDDSLQRWHCGANFGMTGRWPGGDLGTFRAIGNFTSLRFAGVTVIVWQVRCQ